MEGAPWIVSVGNKDHMSAHWIPMAFLPWAGLVTSEAGRLGEGQGWHWLSIFSPAGLLDRSMREWRSEQR